MKYNLSEIMTRAHAIRKARNISLSAALKASWRIAKGGFEMTIDELIGRYGLKDGAACGKPGMIQVASIKLLQKEGRMDEVKSRKPEILSRLAELREEAKKEEEARKAAMAARAAKIAAIPGLKEIRAAQEAQRQWHEAWERSFEGDCGGMGVGPRPDVSVAELRKQYPIADAYLRCNEYANKANAELSGIGENALNALLDNLNDYDNVLARLESDVSAFVERHFWD